MPLPKTLTKFIFWLLISFQQIGLLFAEPAANVTLEQAKAAAAAASSGGAASASSTSCFARDSFITLVDGTTKLITDLKPCDQLLTFHGPQITATQMIMMLHQHRSTPTLFHTLITQSGHRISITSLHLLPVVGDDHQLNFFPAKDVKVGDLLRVMMANDDQVIDSPVVELKMEMKEGFSAPLTTDGTLLVNGVLASCYANVRSHRSAHFYMGIVRWYYRLARALSFEYPFGEQTMDEMHMLPQFMYNFVEAVYPSVLLTF